MLDIEKIKDGVLKGERLSLEDAMFLYKEASLGELSILATSVKETKSGNLIFYNKNIHIEPTNVCIYHCNFCSYRRDIGEEGSWNYSVAEIKKMAEAYKDSGITEVHIVGGVHPKHNLDYYCEVISVVKEALPNVCVKAYTAVEIFFMIQKAKVSISEGLRRLKEAGLSAIPGGGAEIFDEKLRAEICKDKCSSKEWLEVHKEAHLLKIPTNATILYGHKETLEHRLDHLNRLRELQDVTNGFNAFIPLKFRSENNGMSLLGEVSIIEDMRFIAISRIFLDNFPHIKAYWPMFGKQTTALALAFGADDIDGTIQDTTKIYSMAGVKDDKTLYAEEMMEMIKPYKYRLVERDSFYNIVENRDLK